MLLATCCSTSRVEWECSCSGPFVHWSGWNLITDLDLWALLLLIVGLLLPLLFTLVNEEVGEQKKRPGRQPGGLVTLVLLAAYFGARANLHSRAIDLILSREYHGRIALSAAAFPEWSAPFYWRGIAETDNTMEEVDVPLGRNQFDSERSVSLFKPEDSPALELGQKNSATTEFLEYARFPIAKVLRIEADYRFEVRDLRFEEDDTEPANVLLRIDYDSRLQTRSEKFRFASSPEP